MAGAAVGLAAAPHVAVARPVLWYRPPHCPRDSPLSQMYCLSTLQRAVSQATSYAPSKPSLGNFTILSDTL